jgi:hypothetical protein
MSYIFPMGLAQKGGFLRNLLRQKKARQAVFGGPPLRLRPTPNCGYAVTANKRRIDVTAASRARPSQDVMHMYEVVEIHQPEPITGLADNVVQMCRCVKCRTSRRDGSPDENIRVRAVVARDGKLFVRE